MTENDKVRFFVHSGSDADVILGGELICWIPLDKARWGSVTLKINEVSPLVKPGCYRMVP